MSKQVKGPKNLGRTGDDLDDLKASIRKYGQLQPIIVDQETGRVIVGERRRRAASALRLEPDVVEIEIEDEAEELAMRLSEEMTKRDIPLIDKAEAVKRYVDLFAGVDASKSLDGRGASNAKAGFGAKVAADTLGISVDSATKLLRVAGLPTEAKKQIRSGKVSSTAANEIAQAGITQKQKAVVTKKVAQGKITDSQAGVREALKYAKNATPLVRKQILEDPTKSFEEARNTAKRQKDKTKRDQATADEAIPMKFQVVAMMLKLSQYATDLASLYDLIADIPEGPDRKDLARAMKELQRQLDRWINGLDKVAELPVTAAKKRKVLEKVGDEWKEILV